LSVLLDLHSLFILGILLFLAGKRFELERLTNITLGISYFLRQGFEYVGLKDKKFRLMPYVMVMAWLATFLSF